MRYRPPAPGPAAEEPSYLILATQPALAFHVLFAIDVETDQVHVADAVFAKVEW